MSTAIDVVIRCYETVPTHPGIEIIRLPRCANCYDEVHDYSFGRAYCIPAELVIHRQQKEYRRMDAEQLARWEEAEHQEQERREIIANGGIGKDGTIIAMRNRPREEMPDWGKA